MKVALRKEPSESVTSTRIDFQGGANMIQWLQSTRQVELFDRFFVRCSPAYLQQLSPLIALSVGAAVTSSLETHVVERLDWLETVFATINPRVRLRFNCRDLKFFTNAK